MLPAYKHNAKCCISHLYLYTHVKFKLNITHFIYVNICGLHCILNKQKIKRTDTVKCGYNPIGEVEGIYFPSDLRGMINAITHSTRFSQIFLDQLSVTLQIDQDTL